MKKIQKLRFLALIGLMVGTSCEKSSTTPTPQTDCIEGVVIGSDCPSYLFVSVPKGQLGSYFKDNNGVEYNNAISISNIQIADMNVDIKLGASVFFKLDTNQSPSKCMEIRPCLMAFPIPNPQKAYCIKSISNKSCN